jgi:uncharacterized protein YeaO (DUF488 family)
MEKDIQSSSDEIRIKGNEIFKTCDLTLPLSILKERVNRAINFYENAAKQATEKLELFKAHKNTALAYNIINQKLKQNCENFNFEDYYYHSFNCLQSYGICLKFYKLFLDRDSQLYFVINILSVYKKIWNLINETTYLKDEEEIIKRILRLEKTISWEVCPEINAEISVLTANLFFHKSIKLYDNDNYIRSTSMITESLMYLNRSLSYQKQLTLKLVDELQDIHNSATFYLIRNHSKKAIIQGDKLFQSGICENESIDMDMIYLSLDKYREALLHTNCFKENGDVDIELEAIIYSKLGSIFYRIFKNETKAEIYVKQSVDLGLSLHPKNVSVEDWYREATTILNEIRQRRFNEEQKNMNEYRQKYKDELSDSFNKIEEETKKSCQSFLKYIVLNHPPQQGFVYDVEEEIGKSNIKKVLLKLISYYHPDKFSDTDMKKKVLMEEICKYLNQKYDYFKSD